MLLSQCRGMHIKLSNGDRMRSDSDLDRAMEERWKLVLEKNPLVFNGRKFRLCSFIEKDEEIALHISLTNYKEYIHSHTCSEEAFSNMLLKGKELFNNDKAFLSLALGCQCLVQTHDDFLLFMQRSDKVATFKSMFQVAGCGHPEPDDGEVKSDLLNFDNGYNFKSVHEELYSSPLKEVHEETNIPFSCLTPAVLLGICEDERKKPDLLFFSKTNLTLKQVLDGYEDAKDKFESHRLIGVHINEVEEGGHIRSLDLVPPSLFLIKLWWETYILGEGGKEKIELTRLLRFFKHKRGMHAVRTYNRRTRKGNVQKVIKEVYLRDDISCNSELCGICPKAVVNYVHLLSSKPYNNNYLVFDTNIVLHQMDLLEQDCEVLSNVIILQTVMDEARNQHFGIYNRLHALIRKEGRNFVLFSNEHRKETFCERGANETSNDRNDRAIRLATSWLVGHFGDAVNILLVTNDVANRNIAIKNGIQAVSIEEFVNSVKEEFPTLIDYLADPSKPALTFKNKSQLLPDAFYVEHASSNEIALGLKSSKFFQGTIRTNRYNWTEATIKIRGFSEIAGEESVILIQGRQNLNRATDGDIVAIEILPKSMWSLPSDKYAPNDEAKEENDKEEEEKVVASNIPARPTAIVVGIIKRNWRPFCGSIEYEKGVISSSNSLFVPIDQRIPKIKFKTLQKSSLFDKRIVVVIDSWDIYSKFPSGHYQRTLGRIGDRETENEVILIEHDIPTKSFTPEVIACLPPSDWVITPENSIGRLDLRNRCVCSIDPPGCKDIDDALHARRLPNGNLEVGVHIADVGYFVHPGTPLDLEAAHRATTTYFVERRLDMLPSLLTEHLCSLKGNEDHFAFSVLWEMKYDTAEIVAVSYHKSIIHSRRAMTYAQAQDILDDPTSSGEIADGVKYLNHVAKILRKNRMMRGALDLSSSEVRFMMDSETHEPLNVEMYQSRETNKLVEEFMLLANVQVAEKITTTFPNHGVLRRHPTPSQHMFEELMKAASTVGVTINCETSKQLADSLNAAVKKDTPYFNKLIRIMATRCMTQAVYFGSGDVPPNEFRHYGLAAEIYTHFTSPIRRYADVMVHRLLAAAIGASPLPHVYGDKNYIRDVCANMNHRHLMSQLAGRASVSLQTQLFFKARNIETDGLIMKVRSNGVLVLAPQYGIEYMIRLVFLNKKGGPKVLDEWTFNREEQTLRNRLSGVILCVFKPVKVAIKVEPITPFKEELQLQLLNGGKYDDMATTSNKRSGETLIKNNSPKKLKK